MREINLIGREEACGKIARCMDRQDAQLIVVYGRRRVGKTYLINEYFQKRFEFKLTGEYNAPTENQLENFTLELNRQTHSRHVPPGTWRDAFDMLRTYLESLPTDEKQVIFFDEMPWMDTPRSGFLAAFEYFWNSFGSTRDHLVFIVCGSATAWLTEKIDRNKGGLFNRKTCSIFLEPFNLYETEQYLQSSGIYWSRYDIAECYMILGGIPYYLSFLDPTLSLGENINRLFFRKGAELGDEFDNLFRTLFKNSDQFILIAEALGKKRTGLTKTEIAARTGLAYNGFLSEKLNQLVDSGFVRATSFYQQKRRDVLYQLSDYFTLFYFRFARDQYGVDESFWTHTYDNPSRNAWAGLTFEQLCKDHIRQIKRRLGISGILTEVSTWYAREATESEEPHAGAQIDIVIDRRDHTISLCEVKYSRAQFEINKSYDLNLRNKIAAFQSATRTTKSLQLVMITTFGVKKNKYSGIAQGEVLLDDLFEKTL